MGGRALAGGARRAALAAWLATTLVATTLRGSSADDGSAAVHSLATSADFRLKVSAALVVGRLRPAGALEALERALGDSHPAVRVAAAEAMGSLGDGAALPPLEQRLTSDTSPNVKAQIRVTIDLLRVGSTAGQTGGVRPAGALPADVRSVVMLGAMRNATGVRGDELRRVLSEATRKRAGALNGVLLVEPDSPLLKQAAAKRIPVFSLDGNVTQIAESPMGNSIEVRARVEFTVRRDQTLRGTLTGAATTMGSGPAMSDEERRQLQDDAVQGAVQSAMRGAEQGLIASR